MSRREEIEAARQERCAFVEKHQDVFNALKKIDLQIADLENNLIECGCDDCGAEFIGSPAAARAAGWQQLTYSCGCEGPDWWICPLHRDDEERAIGARDDH